MVLESLDQSAALRDRVTGQLPAGEKSTIIFGGAARRAPSSAAAADGSWARINDAVRVTPGPADPANIHHRIVKSAPPVRRAAACSTNRSSRRGGGENVSRR